MLVSALCLAPLMFQKFPERETQDLLGWKLLIDKRIIANQMEELDRALRLMEMQLAEIVRKLPTKSVQRLKTVKIYITEQYPGSIANAVYHPGRQWLIENGRDPQMVRSVEAMNVKVFLAETRRMPNFMLHELAHAYHDQFLSGGFDNPEVLGAYNAAKKAGTYERVERSHGYARPNTFERAYAMVNQMEYFAETTEAFFTKNDFFPFNLEQLKGHDPQMTKLLGKLWD